MSKKKIYDLVIVGAGVSGAAQYYAAARYTNIKNILVLEKESAAGLINSAATYNSQTLHEGDIETNYNLEKATAVKHKAGFTRRYLEDRKSSKRGDLYLQGPKMVLGVGKKEVALLEERHNQFSNLFPGLRKLGRGEIAEYEPKIMQGRDSEEKIIALYNENGVTVDFGKLAEELMIDAQIDIDKDESRSGEVRFNAKISGLKKVSEGYELSVKGEVVVTKYLSICAGAHSMYFAKKLGLPVVKTQSLLLVAGNFYYTPKTLTSKVYTVQNPKLPFSAVHGDPDILNQETKTRYGPTTRIVFNLERGRFGTFFEYLPTMSPFLSSLSAYVRIMFDPEFFFYALKHNLLFLVPGLGNYLFVKEIRKIIPSIKYADLKRAYGQGGVRPQIVQTTEQKPLNLGEAKIRSEQIRFNITPSPGATTCIFNGLSDMQEIVQEIGGVFDTDKMEADFDLQLKS